MAEAATILGALAAHAADRPGDDALATDEGVLGWGAFVARIRSAAAAMAAAGVVPGDRVALLAATGPEAAIAFLGAVAAGACAVPLPMSLRPEAIAGLLADCEPALLVADPEGAAICAAAGAAGCPVLATGPALFARQGGGRFPLGAAGDAPFNIIYSSGTTGRPKGIVHSHAMRNGQARRRSFALGPSARMLLATPIYSNTTLMPMLAALHHGASIRLMRRFDASAYLQLAADWGATHTMLVPVQYRRVMDLADFDRFDLAAMQVKQSTSAQFDAGLKRDVVARFPGKLIEVYGLTEGGVSSALDTSLYPDKLDTVGRAAEGVELKIIDEGDRVLAPGEVGEVVGRSPWMMSGYWRRPDLTEAMLWRDGAGGVFFRSGDLGCLDAEGFLRIVGRRKEMINSGGFNVYPVDLETALLTDPDVAEAAVFAIPSRKWGETPFAVVVLRPGAAADAAAILDRANARLGRMQRIDGLDIRVALPRSSIGKVAKPELAAEYLGRASG
jgi:long-chain acyl-CoA synthetase